MALYAHLFADFGAAGVPGTFKLFFTDCVVGIARSEQILTLEMPIYVDDMAPIGPTKDETDKERIKFCEFAKVELGVR